jgi:uncharacterized membrane protein (DUF373 family)
MIENVFNRVSRATLGLILAFLIVGLAIGSVKLVFNFVAIVQTTDITGTYQTLISDVLSLFILIELSRSLFGYFEHDEINVGAIIDAAMVFVIREILIFLFEKKVTESMLLAMTALLAVLGALRIAWTLVHCKTRGNKAESPVKHPPVT